MTRQSAVAALLGLAIAVGIADARLPAERTVGAHADRSTVTLRLGERLTVRLRECASCGYRWVTAHAPRAAVLRRLSSTYVPPHLAPGAVGGSGTRVLVYRAAGPGFTRIVLSSRGPDGRAHAAWRLAIRVR